jgi:hypothetical protein
MNTSVNHENGCVSEYIFFLFWPYNHFFRFFSLFFVRFSDSGDGQKSSDSQYDVHMYVFGCAKNDPAKLGRAKMPARDRQIICPRAKKHSLRMGWRNGGILKNY